MWGMSARMPYGNKSAGTVANTAVRSFVICPSRMQTHRHRLQYRFGARGRLFTRRIFRADPRCYHARLARGAAGDKKGEDRHFGNARHHRERGVSERNCRGAIALACPLFVPLVEEGFVGTKEGKRS